ASMGCRRAPSSSCLPYTTLFRSGGFRSLSLKPDPRIAVFAFGLVHGLGLATKVQALRPSPDGLVANLIAFNVGVELGQLAALAEIGRAHVCTPVTGNTRMPSTAC